MFIKSKENYQIPVSYIHGLFTANSMCLFASSSERERERERVVIKWTWENINGSISTLSTRRLELQLESNIYRLLPNILFLWDFFSSMCQDLCPLTATMLHNLDPLNYNVMKRTELTLMFDKIYKHQTKHRKWFLCLIHESARFCVSY